MNKDQITKEHVQELFRIYKHKCGGEIEEFLNSEPNKLEKIVSEIREESPEAKEGYIIESEWNYRAKIQFKYDGNEVIPEFDLNEPFAIMHQDEADYAKNKFQKKLENTYLNFNLKKNYKKKSVI